MTNTKGYAIIDENGKYVIGYVNEGNNFRYIAYSTTEKCAIKLLKTKQEVAHYIQQLNKIALSIGEHHQFSHKAIY